MLNLPSNSRFKFTPAVEWDGKETLGFWVPPNTIKTDNYQLTVVVGADQAGRPDLISYQYFGTPELYWAIIAINAPRDVLDWPKAGETIKLPSEAIFTEL